MEKIRRFFLNNAMMLGNFVANIAGVVIVAGSVRLFSQIGEGLEPFAVMRDVARIFDPIAFFLVGLAQFRFARPIRKAFKLKQKGNEVSPELLAKAQRRLLNEPYFAMLADLIIWAMAAVVFSLALFNIEAPDVIIRSFVLRCLVTGILTVTVAFFLLERILQLKLAPILFPQGGLYATPHTFRTRVGVRIAALVFAVSLVPLGAIHLTIFGTKQAMSTGALSQIDALSILQKGLMAQTVVFMITALILARLVTRSITHPLKDIISVLMEIGRGIFQRKVKVTSNDEIGYTGDSINQMTGDLQEREFIKETFGKYVSNQVRDEILNNRVQLDGEMKEVTILFADLRGFTPLVESTPPKEVVNIINSYFKEMAEAIDKYNGLVLQYIGDEIEAVFGAPLTLDDHPLYAVKAAFEMRNRLDRLNFNLKKQGYAPLRHGIGIHTGLALAANIGSPERLSYALVGDTVNVASRLQGLTKELGHDIILSAATQKALGKNFALTALPKARLKGKSKTVDLFALD